MGTRFACISRVLALSIVVTPVFAGIDTTVSTPTEQRSALHAFKTAVNRYVEIRRLHEPMRVDAMTADRESLARWRGTLAAGIRDARVPAVEGDVFGRGVSALIRLRFIQARPGHASDVVFTESLVDDPSRIAQPIGINEALPWGAAVRLPSYLEKTLPALPDDLEYRLIGRDLLLWDTRADLIVDILRDALAAHPVSAQDS
jgi:hypothetical protein